MHVIKRGKLFEVHLADRGPLRELAPNYNDTSLRLDAIEETDSNDLLIVLYEKIFVQTQVLDVIPACCSGLSLVRQA